MDTLVHEKFELKRKKILDALDRSIISTKSEFNKKGVLNSGMYFEKVYEALYQSGEETIKALLDTFLETQMDTQNDRFIVDNEQEIRNEMNGLFYSENMRIYRVLSIECKDHQSTRISNLSTNLQVYTNRITNILIETEKRKKAKQNLNVKQCGPLAKLKCDMVEEINKGFSVKNVFLDIPYSNYEDCEKVLNELLVTVGLNPVIAKGKVTSSAMLCKICTLIQTCKYGISDVSSASNSVAYEYGLMHGMGLKVCLALRKEREKFTDIHGLEHRPYAGLRSFKIEVIQWLLDNVDEINKNEVRKILETENQLLKSHGDLHLKKIDNVRMFGVEQKENIAKKEERLNEISLRAESEGKGLPARILCCVPEDYDSEGIINSKDFFTNKNNYTLPLSFGYFPGDPNYYESAPGSLIYKRKHGDFDYYQYFELTTTGIIYYKETIREHLKDKNNPDQSRSVINVRLTLNALYFYLKLVEKVYSHFGFTDPFEISFLLTAVKGLDVVIPNGFNEVIGSVKYSDSIPLKRKTSSGVLKKELDSVTLDMHEEFLSVCNVTDAHDRKKSIWDLEQAKFDFYGKEVCECKKQYMPKGQEKCLICLGKT